MTDWPEGYGRRVYDTLDSTLPDAARFPQEPHAPAAGATGAAGASEGGGRAAPAMALLNQRTLAGGGKLEPPSADDVRQALSMASWASFPPPPGFP